MGKVDSRMVKALIRVFTSLTQLTSCFDMPKGTKEAITFASKNLDRVADQDEPRVWKDVRMNRHVSIDRLTECTVELVWAAMRFSVMVNGLRSRMGRKQRDFIRLAAIYDQEVKDGANQNRL